MATRTRAVKCKKKMALGRTVLSLLCTRFLDVVVVVVLGGQFAGTVHGIDDRFRNGRMLRFPMPSQIHLSLERFVAQTARKRLVTGVFTHVRNEIRRLAERLRTNHALVRFLACNKEIVVIVVKL